MGGRYVRYGIIAKDTSGQTSPFFAALQFIRFGGPRTLNYVQYSPKSGSDSAYLTPLMINLVPV